MYLLSGQNAHKEQVDAKPSVKKNLPEKVMESLENEIIAGKYVVGDKIPAEPELVQYFQVSRNSVREAVQSLIHAGILEARQGSGTYVIATSRLQVELAKLCNISEQEEIEELRNTLGKFLVKSASKKRNSYDITNLEDKIGKLKEYLKKDKKKNPDLASSSGVNILEENTEKSSLKEKVSLKSDITKNNLNSSFFNISELRALDNAYSMALAQSTNNRAIAALFVYVQEQYCLRLTEDDKDIWINHIKQYGQIVEAIKSKDAKAIKKSIDRLYR